MTNTRTSPVAVPAPPGPYGSPGSWGLLFVLSGNMLLDALEVSAAIVALPSIGAGLHLAPWAVQWVMGGFALGFGALLPYARPLTAVMGRRRVYLTALLLFAATSLGSGLAVSAPLLIALRVVKGMCAALTAPTGLAIITTAFPKGPARARALSVYSMFGAGGFCTGLILAGLLTGPGWRWTLLFPAPVALLLFVAALRLVPRDAPEPLPGWVPRGVLSAGSGLRRSALIAAALNGSYWGLLFLLTFRMQSALHWSPLRTGLALLPGALPPALSALFSGKLMDRFGTGLLIAAGTASATAGYALCGWIGGPQDYVTQMLPTLLLVGAGFVCAFAALHVQAVAELTDRQRQVASGLYQSAVQLGGVIVLAAVGWVSAAHPPVSAWDGFRPAQAVVTAVGAAGCLTALTGVLPRRRPRHTPAPEGQ